MAQPRRVGRLGYPKEGDLAQLLLLARRTAGVRRTRTRAHFDRG